MQTIFNATQIQPKWPLRFSSVHGPYESVATARESVLQNFTFLLQTIPGEWPMNPDLGVGVATYLFESYGSPKLDEVGSSISKQLKKYLPEVQLVSANFIHSDRDQDSLTTVLKIKYSVKLLGIIEEIDFGLDPVTKTTVNMSTLNSKVGEL
jgi:phage baseplate assembly protein W